MAGARDHYQLPLALYEGGLLQKLVTDMYWPADKKLFSRALNGFLSKELVSARFCPGLSSNSVQISAIAMGATAIMKACRRSGLNRLTDKALSKAAKRIAFQSEAALFCYSYYAFDAFRQETSSPKYRFLFQLHPHPISVRRLLLEEVERVPRAKSSLMMEHELALSEEQFNKLALEARLANGWVVSSSHTARTLCEQGISADQIHVVPYGVDRVAFPKRVRPPTSDRVFTIVFVGSLIQRKGLSYLLDAVRYLNSQRIRILLCGRGPLDRHLIADYPDLNIEIHRGLSNKQLIRQMHQADLFVLPSLAEGFAHAILEAMSVGLPVIATSHTCAPDVVLEGRHGFIVPIRDARAIAERISWGIDHRSDLAKMGEAAAEQAGLFTWKRFRESIRDSYKKMIESALR